MTNPVSIPAERTARKAIGAYYTPAPLIRKLLDFACLTPSAAGIRIVDPACGPGDFLRAARERAPGAELFGVDIDADAVRQCRDGVSGDGSKRNQIVVADALLDPPPFLRPQSFDLVLGNPPFVNGIEGRLTAAMKRALRSAYPDVRGAADLAHYFLRQAVDLVRPGGRVAFVLPRAILNSPAARSIRAGLPAHLRPNLIYAPERADFFPGAAVFVCLLVLGPGQECSISIDEDPDAARFTRAPVEPDNWWLAVRRALGHSAGAIDVGPPGPVLSDAFEIGASMTAGDAYDVAPYLIDDAVAPGPKLATTGLIDPGECHWGHRACRYLKRAYLHPRVVASAALPRSLAARVANARRPKVIVAGLATRIEAFLDAAGEYVGAVSTFSIFHPRDDVAALSKLLEYLLRPDVTQDLVSQLGANGLRGRHVTVKKSFLRGLSLPPELADVLDTSARTPANGGTRKEGARG